jgi:hypothetical protein
VSEVLDNLVEHGLSLSAWQRVWLVSVLRRVGALAQNDSRREWVRQQRDLGRDQLLGAEAALALAAIGEVSFELLDNSLRTEPEALGPWFVSDEEGIPSWSGLAQPGSRRQQSSPLYRALLGEL